MLNILGYKLEEYKKIVSSDFVKQLYISTEPIPLSDPPKMNYLWGERAHMEFTKLEILDFASKVWIKFWFLNVQSNSTNLSLLIYLI